MGKNVNGRKAAIKAAKAGKKNIKSNPHTAFQFLLVEIHFSDGSVDTIPVGSDVLAWRGGGERSQLELGLLLQEDGEYWVTTNTVSWIQFFTQKVVSTESQYHTTTHIMGKRYFFGSQKVQREHLLEATYSYGLQAQEKAQLMLTRRTSPDTQFIVTGDGQIFIAQESDTLI